MILGTGTDIIEIFRIEKVVGNTKFINRFFTELEKQYLNNKGIESVAGYFAAKEAVAKALGTGFSGFKFTDIEIDKVNSAPIVNLHGAARCIAIEKGIEKIYVSISHCKNYATAVAVAEGYTQNKYDSYSEFLFDIQKNSGVSTNNREYPLCLIKKRYADTNKGDYGRVYIIGGSYAMSGAVILSAQGALRSGAGLVTCVIPKSILDRVGGSVIEGTYMPCGEKDGLIHLSNEEMDDILKKADVIAIGVGLGKGQHLQEHISYILNEGNKPLVIDADGLNMLCDIKKHLKNYKSKAVLTPHPGEMSRLTGLSTEYINNHRIEVSKNFAGEYKCIVLLKGSETVVTDGNRVYLNHSGNPGMASGGSGDVLTGIIASLIGQGYGEYDAAVIGSYIHGRAGDDAYKIYGYGLTAGDIPNFLGRYIK